MANFVDAQGQQISGWPIQLRPGQSIAVGLTGITDQLTQPIVDIIDATTPKRLSFAKVEAGRDTGTTRFFRVIGMTSGLGRIGAVVGNAVVDWVGLSVSGEEQSGVSRLVEALDQGVLVMRNAEDPRVLRKFAEGDRKVIITDPMVDLLTSLLEAGNVDVMRLYAHKQGPHGIVDGNRILVWGVDIQGFCGLPVRLDNKAAAIEVVANLIEHFPPGHFDLGYPRPTKELQPPAKEKDVFFSVPDMEAARACYERTGFPGSPGGLHTMLLPARNRILAAISTSRATFHAHFADGLNHLHVQVPRDNRPAYLREMEQKGRV